MRVLVVEDEKKVAKALREGLEAEHYDVRVASSGEEGFFLENHETFRLRRARSHVAAARRPGGPDHPTQARTSDARPHPHRQGYGQRSRARARQRRRRLP